MRKMEKVPQEVSRRNGQKFTDIMHGTRFSKSMGRWLCEQLDPQAAAFKARTLAAVAYQFLLVDVMEIKVRRGKQ